MSESQDKPASSLVTVDTLVPDQAFAPGGIEAILQKIEAEARNLAKGLDISREKGRKAIASLAHKIARSKTAIDDAGKSLNEQKRIEIGVVDADRRLARDRLDKLKDEVRAPLDAYLAAEDARIKAHEDAINEIVNMSVWQGNLSSEEINAKIQSVPSIDARDWQEFRARAEKVIEAAMERLTDAHATALNREALEAEEARRQVVEAERQRQEQERLRLERDTRIAAEAAERATREAEAKAAAQVAQAEREAQEAAELARRQVAEAEHGKAVAEARARQAAADAAEREKAAKAMADARERQAARDAERRAAEAVEAERRRVAEEMAEKDRQHEIMMADMKHQAKINREVMAGLVAIIGDLVPAGAVDHIAKKLVTALAKGQIKHVSVDYRNATCS